MSVVAKVAVIVPMFNAERTISATLESIRHQTYEDLEIIVVDDGSDDSSAAIVSQAANVDQRIQLVRQPNLGVAAARNAGAAVSRGDLLAFVDADDLWAAPKIERQVKVIEKAPDVGVVYCWFAQICDQGLAYPFWPQPENRGDVLQRLCRHNFVGNGSSLLVRRAAFEATGGFDVSLRARNAQGCEDWLMCLRLAERWSYDVVPEFLVGYRQHTANMSNDVMQMYRSMQMVIDEYRAKYPQFGDDLDGLRLDTTRWLAERSASFGRWRTANELARLLPKGEAAEIRSAAAKSYRGYLRRSAIPKRLRHMLKRALPVSLYTKRPVYLDNYHVHSDA